MPDTIKDCDPVLIGDTSTILIMYADDLILITHSKNGLQAGIDRLNQYCELWKLKANTDKTQIMILNKSGKVIKDIFLYNNVNLINAQEYKYLGIIMRPSGVFSHSVKNYSCKAVKL